jgi:hypothetical protein
MLHELISHYLQEIESAVQGLEDVYVERYEEEILTPRRVNLRVRLRFLDGHLLEVNEAVIVEAGHLKSLSYRYHFQDKHNRLIFRYDNAPHFQNLPGFPHHKHVYNDVLSSTKPSVLQVLEEARLLAE